MEGVCGPECDLGMLPIGDDESAVMSRLQGRGGGRERERGGGKGGGRGGGGRGGGGRGGGGTGGVRSVSGQQMMTTADFKSLTNIELVCLDCSLFWYI